MFGSSVLTLHCLYFLANNMGQFTQRNIGTILRCSELFHHKRQISILFILLFQHDL